MTQVLVIFFYMILAIARENFQGACNHFVVTATEAPGTVCLIFGMYYSQYIACLNLGVNIILVLGLPYDLQTVFE